MKTKIIILITLLFLSGCGESTDKAIANQIDNINTSEVDKDTNTTTNTTKDVAVQEHKVEYKTFYGVDLLAPPKPEWEVGLTDGDVTLYNKTDDYFDKISIIVVDNKAIKVILYKYFYNDEYGTSSNDSFDLLSSKFKDDYTTVEELDACFGSSYMCQSDNYSYSIYSDDRVKASLYSKYEDSIALVLSSLGVYDIELKVIYETKEFLDFLDSRDDEVLSNF